MAKLLRLRRGTTTQHGSFTGAEGEVTVDTDKTTLVVHPGGTQGGGEAMLREDLNNMPASGVTAGTYGSSSAIPAITVDAKGRVTSATTSAIDSTSIANGTSNVSVAAGGDITGTRDGTERFRVQSNGVKVNNNLSFTAVTGAIHWPESSNGASRQWDIIGDQSANGRLEVKYGGADGASPDEVALRMDANGATSLFHDNSEKLATASGGINVTGTVTCDGLVCDGDANIRAGAGILTLQDNNSDGVATNVFLRGRNSANSTKWQVGQTDVTNENLYLQQFANEDIVFTTNGVNRARLKNDGHFIPDTNNTYDLGSTGNQWRNAYFDGSVNCDGLTCEGDALVTSGSGKLIIKDNDSDGTAALSQINGQDSAGNTEWQVGYASSANNSLYIWNNNNNDILFGTNSASRCYINNSGHFLPVANNTYDLGESSYRWRNIYTNDLNLSNEGGANDVDGTWGNWTIQEGEDDLFLLNRRNGKKYKFNLSEVN